MMKDLELENNIVSFLSNKINPETIYIFGSYLNEYFNDESDIDIAVILKNEISEIDLYNLKFELGCILKKDVDLLSFNDSPTVLKAEILRNNKIIYCKNDDERLYNEMSAIGEYEKFNEERKIIIESKYGRDVWMSL